MISMHDLDFALKCLISARTAWEACAAKVKQIDPAINREWLKVPEEYMQQQRERLRAETIAENAAVREVEFRKRLRAFREGLWLQTCPVGEDMTSNAVRGDLILLDRELIYSGAELQHMRRRYASRLNPGMLREIEKYARKKGWDGFDATVDTAQAQDVCDLLEEVGTAFFNAPDSVDISGLAVGMSADEFIKAISKEVRHGRKNQKQD